MAKTSYVSSGAKIKVVGCGGAGCNAVTRMVREQIRGVEFIACNTDAQALLLTEAPTRIQIGEKLTRGLGAGGKPEVGQKAAEETKEELKEAVEGADMVFVTAGMGGGTGTGSAPVVAKLAKDSGALTIGIVTKPFVFEGTPRRASAEKGIANLMPNVDTLIIIPNERLLSVCDNKALISDAFKVADEALVNGVRAISEVITVPGMINLDFADVRAIMCGAGPAWMSIGVGSGQNRAVTAAKAALSSPMLDVTINGAKGCLFTIAGGNDLTLHESEEAAETIRTALDPEANIIFGVSFDETLKDTIKITLVATGFNAQKLGTVNLKDEEFRDQLTVLKEEGDLDIPAFMRQSSGIHATPRVYDNDRIAVAHRR
jgi:cell division protein FtsZ